MEKTTDFINAKAVQLGKLVLRMTTRAESGHPSSALSLVHIVTTLMYKVMRYDPADPWNPANDKLVISEGHAVPIIYAAYADLKGAYGYSPQQKKLLTIDDLDTLRQITSPLDGHPNPSTGFPFFRCATGSLGQGLSCACGDALGARMDGISKKIYAIIGDGESREGQIWEALDFLIDNSLFNVIPIFNCNGLGQSGPVSKQQNPERLKSKLEAFGFSVQDIDGHNAAQVLQSLQNASAADAPQSIVAHTVKGWGIDELKATNTHGKPLKEDKLFNAYLELDKKAEGTQSGLDGKLESPPKPPVSEIPRMLPGRIQDPDFEQLLKGDSALSKLQKGLLSTRRAFGLALKSLAQVDERIVALDADVKNSTFSEYVAREFPERFIECKIAEQNMMSVAAGIASSGRIPFVSSFAKFLVRGYDQLELAIIAGANLKLVGSHAGINIGADGPSQMGMSDIAFMRAYASAKDKLTGKPLVTVFNPSCAVAAYKCVQLMADLPNVCYLRTMRGDLPLLYQPSEHFEPGGFKLLREGTDLAIVTSGYMVHVCLKLASRLAEKGIKASVIDCYTLPVNPQPFRETVANCRSIITVEDNLGNGLGSEIATILLSDGAMGIPLRQYFVKRLPKSGLTAEDVLTYSGLDLSDEWNLSPR